MTLIDQVSAQMTKPLQDSINIASITAYHLILRYVNVIIMFLKSLIDRYHNDSTVVTNTQNVSARPGPKHLSKIYN